MRTRVLLLPAVLALLAVPVLLPGCAPGAGERKAKLTEDQRDSVLATQPLPGAATVGRAREESAEARERAARLDSLAN